MKHLFLKSPKPPLIRRIILGGGGLILLFAINLIYSCQKSYDVGTPKESRLKMRDGLLPCTLSHGMLKFDDMDAVDDYLEIVDDIRGYHISDDDSGQLLSDVDPGVNDLEGELGFFCLSSLYDSLEYIDDEFRSNARSSVDIYIPDPDLQLILNRNHEVWIEDTIYKLVSDFKYYKIVGADIDVLNSIRSDPEEPVVDDNTSLEYFNYNVPPISFNTVFCKIFIEFLLEPPAHAIDPTIYITVKTIDQDNVISHCSLPYVRIFWGDGTNNLVQNAPTLSHQYDVDADETETFTITAQLGVTDSNDCLSCDEQTYEATTTYTVSNNFCKKTNADNEVRSAVEFSAGGGDWKAVGRGGQNPRYRLFNDPKVWGELYLYKKNGNGSYKRKRPDYKSYVRIFKSTFDFDDCEDVEHTFDSYAQYRDSKVRVEDKAHRNFSTQDELPDEPLLDFKVYITSNSTADWTAFNRELFPD